MDRACLDFERLFSLDEAGALFVTRAKSNTDPRRVCSAPSDREQGIIRDQTVATTGIGARTRYPRHLRRIRFNDPDTRKALVFLTNHFRPPPATIRRLHKSRWQVEMFFKWTKQHLRVKKFYGASENAVKVRIWAAASVYLLVAIVRKRLGLDISLYTLLQVLSVTLFEKMPLNEWPAEISYSAEDSAFPKQWNVGY